MSIRATGKAKEGTAPDGKKGPIIEQLTRGISVDYVTTPGAGGQVLQLFEAVRTGRQSQHEEGDSAMDAAELKKLQEANRKLAQRLATSEARGVIATKLSAIRLPDNLKIRITERCAAKAPITIDGDLDLKALDIIVETEIKDRAEDLAALTGDRSVLEMGAPVSIDPKEAKKAAEELDEAYEDEMKEIAKNLGIDKPGRKFFIHGRDVA